MILQITKIAVVFILLASSARANTVPPVNDFSHKDPLVTIHWLHKNLGTPNLIVLDTTVQIDFSEKGEVIITSGRVGYENGHIPTAGFADLTGDLIDTSAKFPYALPSPEKFAEAMGNLGVGDNTQVVLYASHYSAWAARVWWMLRWIGFDNAFILDGGLTAWIEAGYPLSTEAVSRDQQALSVALRSQVIAERDEVFAAINDDKVVLIDAMPAAHYRGEMIMYDRAGHIPTAINIPSVLAEDGYFFSDTILEEMHPIDNDVRVITYCGGGISASANAFAMHRLGFTNIAVYMNSLEEWTADPANPLKVISK